jgi:hypothetical protein
MSDQKTIDEVLLEGEIAFNRNPRNHRGIPDNTQNPYESKSQEREHYLFSKGWHKAYEKQMEIADHLFWLTLG